MKKKTKKIIEQAEIVGILLCISALIWIIVQFMNNVHNVDLYTNIKTMIESVNDAGFKDINNNTVYVAIENVTDQGSDYQTRPLQAYYIFSSESLKTWFIYGLLDSLLLGILLSRRLK